MIYLTANTDTLVQPEQAVVSHAVSEQSVSAQSQLLIRVCIKLVIVILTQVQLLEVDEVGNDKEPELPLVIVSKTIY